MITWQDPVALLLAVGLVWLALGWRRRILKRGEGSGCGKCPARDHGGAGRGDANDAERVRAPASAAHPVVIDVSRMRLNRAPRALAKSLKSAPSP